MGDAHPRLPRPRCASALRGESADAAYYDESRKINVSFAGRSMCAVLLDRTKNIGVTPPQQRGLRLPRRAW
ncbi:MAG: hypothetical protein U1F25_16825 [Rubrivivax sp.]